MSDIFSNWLHSGDKSLCQFGAKGNNYFFIRLEKNVDFDYLYYRREYHAEELTRGGKFEYAGIYYKRDGMIYDATDYWLPEAFENYRENTAAALRERLKNSVRAKVEAAIDNDRSNLQVTEITTERIRADMEYFYQHRAHEMAREAYLNDEPIAAEAFQCAYSPEEWTEDTLLAYIADPDGYAEQEAAAYIKENQEVMLDSFLTNDAVYAAYEDLLAATDNPVHIVKKIRSALNASSAKTVNVTIFKDGTEFTFKTEADVLRRDCTSYYNTWSMVAADRRRFEARYGRSDNYLPQEIRKITYSKNVLYEASGN